MSKTLKRLLLLALAPLAAAALAYDETTFLYSGTEQDGVFQQYCYTNGVFCLLTNASEKVVEPTGLVQRRAGVTNVYTLVRRPEGQDLDGWVLDVKTQRTVAGFPPARLADVYPATNFTGTVVSLPGAGVPFAHWDKYLLLIPCFSTLHYDLVYMKNDGSSAGQYDTPATHASTDAVTLADCFWERKGYDFLGWARTPGGAAEFASADEVTGIALGAVTNGPFRLYAAWRRKVYTIALDANGGTADAASVEIQMDGTWTLPTPSRENFTFRGWFTQPAGGTRIQDGDPVTRIDIAGLYAQWEVDTRIVTVGSANPRMGSVSPAGELELDYNAELSLVAAPETGCRFLGWSDGAMSPSRKVTVTTNAVYWAYFGDEAHTVAFVYRTPEGAWETNRQSVAYGARAWPPADARCKRWPGHPFVRWSDDYAQVTEDLVVTAEYGTADPATVYFLANGGYGAMAPQQFPWGQGRTLSPNAFSATNRVVVTQGDAAETNLASRAFRGWALKPGATTNDIVYADGAYVTDPAPDGWCALYAVWEPLPESDPEPPARVPTAVVPTAVALTASSDSAWKAGADGAWREEDYSNLGRLLQGVVKGPGVLQFTWCGANTQMGMGKAKDVCTFTTNGVEVAVLSGDGAARQVECTVTSAEEVALGWHRTFSSAVSVSAVTWTADLPEDPAEEWVVTTAVPGPAQAAYHVWTNLFCTGNVQTGVVAIAACTATENTAKDVGSYQAAIALRPGAVWADGSTGAARTADWSIAKGTYDMSGVRFADATVFFDGTAKSLAVSGALPDGVSVAYRGNGVAACGAYAVEARFTGDADNFEPIPVLDATLTIVSPFGDHGEMFEPVLDELPPGACSAFDTEVVYDGLPHGLDTNALMTAFAPYAAKPGRIYYAAENSAREADWREQPITLTDAGTTSFWYRVSTTDFGNFVHPVRLTVRPRDMAEVAFAALPDATWTGGPVAPVPETAPDEPAVVAAEDRELSYADNTDVGTASVTVAGRRNFTGSQTLTFAIVPAVYDMGGVSFDSATYAADGTPKSLFVTGTLPPGVSVSYRGNRRTEPGDYTVTAVFTGDANHEPIPDMTAVLTLTEDAFAPELFPSGDLGAFKASVATTYLGWLRDADGRLAGTLSVKTSKSRGGAAVRTTIVKTMLGARRQKVRTTVAPGADARDKYGIIYGAHGLAGTFAGYDVVAGRDLTKSRTAADKARVAAFPQGVWTLAFDTPEGAVVFSLTLAGRGKAKLKGLFADGTKVSASAQAVCGEDGILAVPVAYAKRGRTAGFVVWIGADGAAAVTDVADDDWSAGVVAPYEPPANGAYTLDCTVPAWRDYLAVVDGEDVTPGAVAATWANGGFRTPRSRMALKLKLAAKTGVLKGSFKLFYRDGARVRSDKATLGGVVLGEEIVGNGRVRRFGSFPIRIRLK